MAMLPCPSGYRLDRVYWHSTMHVFLVQHEFIVSRILWQLTMKTITVRWYRRQLVYNANGPCTTGPIAIHSWTSPPRVGRLLIVSIIWLTRQICLAWQMGLSVRFNIGNIFVWPCWCIYTKLCIVLCTYYIFRHNIEIFRPDAAEYFAIPS